MWGMAGVWCGRKEESVRVSRFQGRVAEQVANATHPETVGTDIGFGPRALKAFVNWCAMIDCN